MILELNIENYSDYFVNVATYDSNPGHSNTIRIVAYDPIHFQLTSFDSNAGMSHLYPGNLFGSQIPDNFDSYVTIQDDNGFIQTIHRNSGFSFRMP